MDGRRNIVDFRRQGRVAPSAGASGGGAPASTLPYDTITAAGGTVAFIGSVSHRVRAAYAGGPFRMFRASDNATQEAAFTVDGVLDEAAVVAFGGASDVLIDILRDQGTGGFDMSQSTEAAMPKIYDGATGKVVKIGGLPAALFTGAQRWSNANPCGLSGAIGVTTSCYHQPEVNQVGTRAMLVTGNFDNAYTMQSTGGYLDFPGYREQPTNRIQGTADNRIMSLTNAYLPYKHHLYTHRVAAAQQIGSTTIYMDAAELTTQLSTSGTGTVNITAVATSIGSTRTPNAYYYGKASFWLIAGQHYTGSPLTALTDWGAELQAATHTGVSTVVLGGQSNAHFIDARAWATSTGYAVVQPTRSGAPITEWAAGQPKYLSMVEAVQRADPSLTPFVVWAQGENECQIAGTTASLEHRIALADLVARLDSDSGRSPYWFFLKLHAQGTYETSVGNMGRINDGIDIVVAARPGNSEAIDPATYGDLYTLVQEDPRAHWTPTTQTAILAYIDSRIQTLGGAP